MSCNCSKSVALAPVNPELPDIADFCPATAAVEGNVCENSDVAATPSNGYTLPTGWDDAVTVPTGQGARLLMRLNGKLAKFGSTSGFISIRKGLAYLVPVIPLGVRQLWHHWWKPAGANPRPILGDPLPYASNVIADSYGNLYAIKGLAGDAVTTDSVTVWSLEREQWETRETADFPILCRGLLPTATALELTGFAAIATSGAATDVRELKALAGQGIVILTQQATIPSSCDCEGCEPQAAVASVATLLAQPADGTWKLRCVVTAGVAVYSWVDDS